MNRACGWIQQDLFKEIRKNRTNRNLLAERMTAEMDADLIVVNGKVITVDPADTIVEAFAVNDGRIVATGASADMERLAVSGAKRIDLQGKTVTPGLIDTHVHVVSLGSIGAGAGLGFLGTDRVLDISKATSIQDILDIIASRIREREKGELIITGWYKELLKEGRRPTRWDLDAVSPDNPVFMSGYPYAIVNSHLLKQAGITRDTVSPPGGEIEKDPQTGEPTGAMAFQAVYQLLPPLSQPSVEDTETAIMRVQRDFLAEGLTAYKDAGLRDNAIAAYRNLRLQNGLLCRTQMMYTWLWTLQEAKGVVSRHTPHEDDMLMLRAVKLSLDGGISSRTAWGYDDWYRKYTEVVSGEKGYWKIPPDEFEEMVSVLHNGGLQIGCHCCGDRAIDTYIDAVEKALEKTPAQNRRHTVIHCCVPTDQAVERMRMLGDNIAIEPQSVWLSNDKWAAGCGPERSLRFKPMKQWLQNNIIVGNGCDFPPEPYPPRIGLWSACSRECEAGRFGKFPYGTDQRLTVREALYTYTMGGAKCMFWEDRIGSLEPGKYADFVVWDKDLYTVPMEEIRNLKVLLTAVNGEVLYEQ